MCSYDVYSMTNEEAADIILDILAQSFTIGGRGNGKTLSILRRHFALIKAIEVLKVSPDNPNQEEMEKLSKSIYDKIMKTIPDAIRPISVPPNTFVLDDFQNKEDFNDSI